MPLYEYQCDACGHRFEVIQKFSDAPPDKCPSCGGTVSKMQSAPAFQFKGTGWYITDYAKKDTGGGKGDAARSGKKDGGSSGDSDGGEKAASSTTGSGSSSASSGSASSGTKTSSTGSTSGGGSSSSSS
jgi:putative FmdB family regulatory protein